MITAKRLLAAALAILSVGVLAGWLFDVAVLKSVALGLTTMKANTACCFLLAAIAVATSGASAIVWQRTGQVMVALMAVIGFVTLAEYLLHLDLGLDQLLIADPATTSAPFNGRMSPVTAIGFVAAAAALYLTGAGRTRRTITAGHALAAVPGLIGLLSLTGYAYDVTALYRFGPFVTVALHTAIGMVLLAAAVLLTRAASGWFAPYADRPIARSALIQIAILALLLPFLTGLLVVKGIRAGYYEAQVAPALFAVAAVVILLWLALHSASILGRAERDIEEARADARQRTQALARTNDRHTALVENVPQLVWTCLPDGNCDYFSPQWLAYTGLSEAEQLGFDWLSRVIHPGDEARTLDHWMGAVAGRHPYDIEYRIRSAAGDYRWFKTRGTPIRNGAGTIEYWFGTSTDIQDIVEAREVLARSRADLEQQVQARTAELMAVEEQLRQSQKMEAVGQLTGGVAHDFNNLLTIIRSAADLLRRPALPDERRRAYLDAIADTADRAAKLTAQLLAFSRRQALKPELFDAREKVAGILDMLRSIVGARITVELVPPAVQCCLEVDLSQFETAIVNMTVNARDAMNDEGRIVVTLSVAEGIPKLRGHPAVPGAFVALSIADTGIGIATETIDRIFEPFFTTKTLGKGTGLGLSQVFGFAKQSGGDIEVVTAPGQGSTFILYLPRTTPGQDMIEPPVVAPKAGCTTAVKSRRVLVVEDNVDVGRFSTQLLEDLGYHTVWAHDAAEALAIIDRDEFDIVFSDVVMPGMNGVELGQTIQARFPDLPVILTSGYSDVLANEGRHGFELLKKPYAVEDLSRLLRRTFSD